MYAYVCFIEPAFFMDLLLDLLFLAADLLFFGLLLLLLDLFGDLFGEPAISAIYVFLNFWIDYSSFKFATYQIT